MNSAVPGDQAWLAARPDEVEDRVFSLNPTAVVVVFGMNDCRRFDFGHSPSDVQIAARAKNLATFREATRRIATNILDRCGPVPLYLLSPHPGECFNPDVCIDHLGFLPIEKGRAVPTGASAD